jgi:hypothetical protein
MIKSLIKNKGFTLLEVVLASFLLFLFLAGTFSLLSTGVFSLTTMRNRFLAFYLAQEGIEIVKNIRDTNFLQNNPWLSGIGTGDKEADYQSSNLSNFLNNYLKKNNQGFFQYSDGENTIFKRKITISQIDPNKVQVRVEITWSEKGVQKNFTIVDEISNWY